MNTKCRQTLALIIIMAMLGGPSLTVMGSTSNHGGEDTRGPLSHENPPVWTDPLDDMSHVYLPTGGLVGVEVAGGEVHLLPGRDEGWVASEIITCPADNRFDLVLLDVDTPGDSYVEISILDATKEASQVGFANETIPGYEKIKANDVSVYNISRSMKIRIQVNLVASGTDRPRLLAWTLFFIGLEEWRDDFLGTGKMSDFKNINFTGEGLEVNLTGGKAGGGTGSYEAYPTIATASYSSLSMLYPNSGHTGYQDNSPISRNSAYGVTFSELNGDDYLDCIVAERSAASSIFWGSSSGTFSTSNKKDLTANGANKVASGDFNGDGWNDLAFACQISGAGDSLVFLNQGDGTFNNQADITFTGVRGYLIGAGDVNVDGYDDVVISYTASDVFYGGPSGPDTTKDITVNGWLYRIEDVNLDGYVDVLTRSANTVTIYLGDSSGLDATADFTLDPTGNQVYGIDAGDINGDGYKDIVALGYQSSTSYPISIFEGDENGWSNSRKHDDLIGVYGTLKVADIDKDGYEDVVYCIYGAPNYQIKIALGGTSWPTSAAISKTVGTVYDIAIAIPEGEGGIRAYRGTFTSEAITLPRPQEQKWDMLFLEGSTPKNTTMTISVLDVNMNPIPGYEDRPDWNLDLSPITHDNTIRVAVTITSEFNNTTPVLNSLMVKWMDKMTWREEFYGDAKVQRILNMDIADSKLKTSILAGSSPQLLFASIRGDGGYNTRSHLYMDSGGLDYLSRPPMVFKTSGTSAIDVADVNGDGYLDVAWAVHMVADSTYAGQSPLFYGSPVGWKDMPDHTFSTEGARDVLLDDLNGDGHMDVVFAQEQNPVGSVNSTLFWGSASGWNSTPDVEFVTTWASGVVAADVSGDGLLDLAFACYKSATSTGTDSMVFVQESAGFCGTQPSYKLPTKGAKAVAAGDINGDTRVDLVFANALSGGYAEIDSYIYWGKAGGGFEESSPKGLPTSGAEDVKVADLDGDSDLDVVFANALDNTLNRSVDSYVYLNDGTGGFSTSPDARLPTVGAIAVEVADLDGTGRADLIFAGHFDGTTFEVESLVYLGGASGWSGTPDMRLPTVGASDCMATNLFKAGSGGYMSKDIKPEDPNNIGYFNTFKYTAQLGASQTGKIQIIDVDTWEVITETTIQSGSNDWVLGKSVRVKEHPHIKVIVTGEGLDMPGQFELDDLWLNWTRRVRQAPEVLNITLSDTRTFRTNNLDLWVNATDEYSRTEELRVVVEHRLNGTTGWSSYLVSAPAFIKGTWTSRVTPRVDAPVGIYDFRARVMDTDNEYSEYFEALGALEVLNNLPTAPEVSMEPARPVTTSTLSVKMLAASSDIESNVLSYNYSWYRDGVLVEELTGDSVAFTYTSKGENWSLEVSAWDGDDLGPSAVAWRVIQNAAPAPKDDLPDPEFDEDTVDSDWLNLATAFEDPDGDPITWSVDPAPLHFVVGIDEATGQVTLTPEENWNGAEEITFYASDGELRASQKVTVTVLPINDIPKIATVDGAPVTEDPIVYIIKQGELLVMSIGVVDVEGDEVIFSVPTALIEVDSVRRELRFEPDNEAVGWMNFTLRIYDTVSPGTKASLNFSINVENENDPMDVPRITNPTEGSKYKENQTFSLIGICEDPDTIYGQILNFSWSSNISGHLGYGSSITVAILEPGTHLITLTVRDPDFEQRATVEIIITERPKQNGQNGNGDDDGDEEKGLPLGLISVGIIIVLVVVGVLYVMTTKRKTEEFEEEEEAAEKRDAIERMARAVKATADQMELERGTTEAKPIEDGVESEDFEEVKIETAGAPDHRLSMEAKTTKEASEEIKHLWQEMEEEEPEVDEAAMEELRIDNLKRKYQTAISRLPYGIPSEGLIDMEWTELAALLATGAKKTLPDGREVTEVEGRWYFSDPKDSSTFLKEHGAKPKEKPKKIEPTTDREKLLAKLEERFILGEITEETYKELKEKYKQ
jgi:hypothetical protein